MPLATIPINRIAEGRRLRNISEAQVESLVASIGEIGLLNPITVYPRPVIDGGLSVDGYGLVAGAHRLEACKRLGLVEVDASVVELSELERQIAECDENLCGSVLSKSERAIFTQRRKDAYEALHPETKVGATGRAGKDRQVGDDKEAADRFTTDTASKTGQSERAVQRDAERGSKISERALSMLKGTSLDTGKYLDHLKTIAKDDQVKTVKADLSAAKAKKTAKPKPAKNAPEPAATEPADTRTEAEREADAIQSPFDSASDEGRALFLARNNLTETSDGGSHEVDPHPNAFSIAGAPSHEALAPSAGANDAAAKCDEEFQAKASEDNGATGTADAEVPSDSMAGEVSRVDAGRTASATSEIMDATAGETALNPNPRPNTSPDADKGEADTSSDPASPAPFAVLSKADQVRLIRPHCQHPDDLEKCGGSGRKHCPACTKAMAEGEAA